jgi:hypothetical protein
VKVIIAGSRFITNYEIVKKAIKDSGFEISEVVCGMAAGVDSLGEKYAKENNIKLACFYADWRGLGKIAGIKRNEVMGDYADALILVYDGKSKGSTHMLKYAKKKKLKIFVKDTSVADLTDFFDI